MPFALELILYPFAVLVSYAGVEAFRRWSLRRQILDVPNERSSHTAPTVRGGGLIIVFLCLAIYAIYTIFVTRDFRWGYFTGAALVAVISWLDDLYTISFVWRFLIHFAAALLAVSTLGYFDKIYLPFFREVNTDVIGAVLTLLWIVWLTNAYNFMDGIDGIAGTQAVIAGIGWLAVGQFFGFASTGFYGGVVACACLGFLIQNWQPAKIFMGDVGSAFLGFSFAVFPLLAKNESAATADAESIVPVIGVLLVWLFVFDTVFTFARRVLKGEKVWEAHRSHIYQRLVISGLAHRFVTSLYGAISILTAAATVLWLLKRDVWGVVLILLIGLQSAGLLLYARFSERDSLKV